MQQTALTHLEHERAALSSRIQELQQERMQLEISLMQSNQALQHQAAENIALTSQVQVFQQEKNCLVKTADSQAREHEQKLQQLEHDRAAFNKLSRAWCRCVVWHSMLNYMQNNAKSGLLQLALGHTAGCQT